MARLLIRREEMILFKNSEAGKNSDLYGNLFASLQTYDALSEEDFTNHPTMDDTARAVILNSKQLLIDEIKNEWFAVGCNDDATGEVRCQLCHTKNKFVFYIQNKLNNNELHVGSECIKKFPGLKDVSKVRRTFTEKQKQQAEIKRRIDFDKIDLDNINYIKSSEEWFNNFKILLPYKLYNDIKTLLYNLNSLRTNYIKNGGELSHITQQYIEFKKLLETCNLDAERIYKQNIRNPLCCKKELADWLLKNYPNTWESIMKNDGLLTKETLKYCYLPAYVETNLNKFKSKLNDTDINIFGTNGNYIRFVIKNSDYLYPLYFGIPMNEFMKNIGCQCLTDNSYRFNKQDLSAIVIENNNSNFNAMCNRLLNPLQNIGLKIEKSDYSKDIYYVRLPQINRTSKWSDRVEKTEIGYKKIDERAIFEKFNRLIFANDKEIEHTFSQILNQLNRTTKWMSQEEKNRMDEISKSLSIQQQREFTPYS